MFSPVWVMADVIACVMFCGDGEEWADEDEVKSPAEGSSGMTGACSSSSIGNEVTGSTAPDGGGRSRNAAVEQIFSANVRKISFLATKSVSHRNSTIAARVPITVTPINPSLVVLDPTLAAFFAPDASRSFESHSRAAGTERLDAASASRALEREIGFCLRSSAMRLMGTLTLARREEVEKVFRCVGWIAWRSVDADCKSRVEMGIVMWMRYCSPWLRCMRIGSAA